MRYRSLRLVILAGMVSVLSLRAMQAEPSHTQARLVLDSDTVRPGESFLAGIQLIMDAEWHTYWRNPGASGMATAIDWELPEGVTAGPIQWPVPSKLPEDELTTYIYEKEVVLLVPLQVATNVAAGSLALKAQVSWLECKVQCIPGGASLEATLRVGPESKPSAAASQLRHWQTKLPQTQSNLDVQATWAAPQTDKLRNLVIEWMAKDLTQGFDFYPHESDGFEVQPNTVVTQSGNGVVRLTKGVKLLSGEWPGTISGLLIGGTATNRTGIEVTLQLGSKDNTSNIANAAVPLPPLWQMLLYAFIGGIILNIMPCVLPVIALKILGFVGQARDEPAKVRRMGLVYVLGVVISFLMLAGLVIGVKAAGHQAGWGMQFGNPQFLVILVVVVTLVALNLFGLFEITPGARVMDTAGALASRQGYAGAFFNGVLATVLATPCTAPFLGVALGFAFAQGAASIVLMFTVVALGLAFPYVLLSWQPAWLRFLPRPGAWMERFKVLMGFPLLATAIWLYSLTLIHYGPRAWWLALFLVVLGLAAWVYGEFVQRHRVRPVLAAACAVGLLAVGFAYTIEGQLRWRSPIAANAANSSVSNKPGGIDWLPWSPEAVEQGRASGRVVLVDFTADWCLTCQANKKFALEVPEVQSRLKEINALALLGDYTRLPAAITRELNRFGRAGVPLVLVFSPARDQPPQVLPEALTPGVVLGALNRAAGREP